MSIRNAVKRALAGTIVVGLGLIGVSSAEAGTSTGTLNLTVDVQSSCTVAAPDIVFGTYVSGQTPAVTGNSTITVTCGNNGLSVALTADNGLHASGTQRRLANVGSTSFLNYDVSAPPSGTFGTGANGRTVTIAGGTATLAVTGNIAGGQTPLAAATHTDTLTITANY
jgi:spore coat protein U-like protein